jgi:PAS domain S-box-containing protein
LKEILGLGAKADQASVLDAAVVALEQIQASPEQSSAAAVALSMPFLSSSDLDDVLNNLVSEPSSLQIQPASAVSTGIQPGVSMDMLFTNPFDPLVEQPTLSSTTTLSTSLQGTVPTTPALDSKYLPRNVSIMIVTNTMQILEINRAGAELFGLPDPAAVMGKYLADLFDMLQEPDYARQNLQLILGQRQSVTSIKQLCVRATGKTLWYRATATSIDSQPDAVGIRRFLMVGQPVEEPAEGPLVLD